MTDYGYTHIKTIPDITTGTDPRESCACVSIRGETTRYIYEAPEDQRDFMLWASDTFDDQTIFISFPTTTGDWTEYCVETNPDTLKTEINRA